jgi:hypothetical protein
MPLSEILAVDAVTKVTGAEAQQHWFQIRTANVDFFVGDDSQVKSGTRYIDNAILYSNAGDDSLVLYIAVRYPLYRYGTAIFYFFVGDDIQVKTAVRYSLYRQRDTLLLCR